MIPIDLHALYPGFGFLTLFVLVILFLLYSLMRFRQDRIGKFATPDVLKGILEQRSKLLYLIVAGAICIVWVFSVLALMQPQGNGRYPEGFSPAPLPDEQKVHLQRKAHEVVILVDASASMQVEDTRTGISRFEMAKEIAEELIGNLQGENVSLFAFTSDLTQLSPSTLDYLFARLMLREMRINEGEFAGTDFLQAMTRFREQFMRTVQPKMLSLVILSDGGDTRLESFEPRERVEEMRNIRKQIDQAELYNLRLYTVGVGSKAGGIVPGVDHGGRPVRSVLDESLLRSLAEKGRGKYFVANQLAPIDIVKEIRKNMDRDDPFIEEYALVRSLASGGKEDLIYDRYFQIPLGCAILFLLLVIYLPASRVTLVILIISTATLEAQPGMRWVSAYDEAGDVEKATELLEELKGVNPQSWQQAFLLYDQGTVEMEGEELKDAIMKLQAVPLDEKSSPLLKRNVRLNLGLAWLRLGDLSKEQDFSLARFSYRQVLREMEGANLAACELVKLEGGEGCDTFPEIENLRLHARRQLSQLLTNFEKVDLRQGIPLILSGIGSARQYLEFLKVLPPENPYYQKYLAYGIRAMEGALPVWESLKLEIMDHQPRVALERAEDEYHKSVRELRNEEFEKSLVALQNASDQMADLMGWIWSDDPIVGIIQNLLAYYHLVLGQIPLQESSLYGLQTEQTKVHGLLRSSDRNLNEMERADRFLRRSIESVKEYESSLARVFLEEARMQIERIIRQEETVEEILESAIEDQQHAIQMHQLLQEVSKGQDKVVPLLEFNQKDTLDTASPFLEAVFALQEKEFANECQCKPWDQVLPLFDRGWNEAQEAKKLLSRVETYPRALLWQERALNDWKEALKRLREEEQPEPEVAEAAPEEEQTEEQNVEEVLRQLQEMNLDDRDSRPQQRVLQEGVRPW